MRILALEEGFPPELMSAHFALEFSRELTKRGHNVTVVTVFPRKHLLPHSLTVPKHKFFYWEQIEDIPILRVCPQFRSQSVISRAIEYIIVPLMLLPGGIIAGKKDVIHVQSPPLFLAFIACILGRLKRMPVILRLWDIHPDALEKMGVVKNKLLIGVMEMIEKLIYRHVDHITVIAKGYKSYLLSRGVPPEKVSVIPNWTNLESIKIFPSDNELRLTYGLDDKFVVTCAGSMSWIQDLETIIEAASAFRDCKNIIFVFCGDGVKKELLVEKSKRLKLRNIIFIPPQPLQVYLKILAASNVCIVSLKSHYTSPAVPARLPSILAFARPVIANVPYGSDTFNLIKEAKCGLWVEPENPEAFAEAVSTLYRDKSLTELLGIKGRQYAERHLSLTACIDKYEMLLGRIINSPSRKMHAHRS